MSGTQLLGVLLGETVDVLLSPRREFGGIIPDVVVDESHTDSLSITEHPVENGAPVSDHAYVRPAEVKVRMGWSPSSSFIGGPLGSIIPISSGMVSAVGRLFNGGAPYLETVYQQLLELQATREPFELTTGKRKYENMLLESLLVDTDREKENALFVTCSFRQVIIVRTLTAEPLSSPGAPPSEQAIPAATAAPSATGTQQLQPAPASVNPAAAPA